MPLVTMMTAENTVSRATTAESGVSLVIIDTMRPTSITVTASANTMAPREGPTRAAMTSAWWTDVMTEIASTTMASRFQRGCPPPSCVTRPSAKSDSTEDAWLRSSRRGDRLVTAPVLASVYFSRAHGFGPQKGVEIGGPAHDFSPAGGPLASCFRPREEDRLSPTAGQPWPGAPGLLGGLREPHQPRWFPFVVGWRGRERRAGGYGGHLAERGNRQRRWLCERRPCERGQPSGRHAERRERGDPLAPHAARLLQER